MKRTLYTLILLQVICLNLLKAQSSDYERNIIKSKKELNQLLNTEFSKIITGNSFSNFGRYISVSTTDKSLKLSGATVNNLTVWSYNISAGANDGIASIFSGLELNTNVGAEFTYNKIVNLFKKKIKVNNEEYIVTTNHIGRNDEINNWKKNEKTKTYNKYKSDSLDIANDKKLIHLKYKIKKIRSRIVNLRLKQQTVNEQLRKDSIKYAIQRTIFDSVNISKEIKKLSQQNFRTNSLKRLNKKYKKELKKLYTSKLENSKIKTLDLTWFSMGYGFNNKSFNLFDETKLLSEQITNDTYLSHQFNIALSRFKNSFMWNTDYYWSLGLNLNFTNNINELSKKEVIDTEIVSQSPLREIRNKKEVFIGEYKEGIEKVKIFFDYYKFIGDGNIVAIHLNPTTITGTGVKPVTSILTGLLFPIKKSEKSSFVNVEIFYKLNDIFNTQNHKKSILHRNTFGIGASFPLKFKSKN